MFPRSALFVFSDVYRQELVHFMKDPCRFDNDKYLLLAERRGSIYHKPAGGSYKNTVFSDEDEFIAYVQV
jgi:hypothetical protein